MKGQPEALRLADALENGQCFDVGSTSVAYGWMRNDPTSEAANELRRLHAESERLREAVLAEREACAKMFDGEVWAYDYREIAAAIRARNKQEQPVAWSHNLIENIITHRPADIDRHPDRWTPLYAEPKPCPTCQAAVAAVEQGQSR